MYVLMTIWIIGQIFSGYLAVPGIFPETGRGTVIRTPDFLLPKQVLYQAELYPVGQAAIAATIIYKNAGFIGVFCAGGQVSNRHIATSDGIFQPDCSCSPPGHLFAGPAGHARAAAS